MKFIEWFRIQEQQRNKVALPRPEEYSKLETLEFADIHDEPACRDPQAYAKAQRILFPKLFRRMEDAAKPWEIIMNAFPMGPEMVANLTVLDYAQAACERNFKTRTWFHGTTKTASELPSVKHLKCPEGELGIHFGSPAAAVDRLADLWLEKNAHTARVFPARLHLRKSLLIHVDLCEWHDQPTRKGGPNMVKLFSQLLRQNGIKAHPSISSIRQSLSAEGYDSLLYPNWFEGSRWPGDRFSVIIWDPALIEPAAEPRREERTVAALTQGFVPLQEPACLDSHDDHRLVRGWPPKVLARSYTGRGWVEGKVIHPRGSLHRHILPCDHPELLEPTEPTG